MDNDVYRRFEEEIFPLADNLYNFAYSLTRDEAAASDLVQEAFLRAFRALENFKTGTNAKAWLFTILRNYYINEFRKKKNKPTQITLLEARHIQEDSAHLHSSAYTDLREEIFDSTLGDEVSNALQNLPPIYREVIILCDIEELKYDEIAEMLNVPVGTVRSRINRGRSKLRELLKAYYD